MSSASFPSLIFVMLIFWMKYEVNCIPNDFFCKPSDVECLIMMDWDGIEPTSSKNMKEYDNNKLRNQSNDNGGAPRHAEFVPHSPLIPCNRL